MAGVGHIAIVLAAGQGSRMNSDIPKQFLKLDGKPLIFQALKAFEDSFIDEIIFVVPAGMEDYCREEIVCKYGFTKVVQIVSGGGERFDSVYRGLKAIGDAGGCDYVYIHDGARPFVDAGILNRAKACVAETGACVAAMPVKDTIRIVDDRNRVIGTPERGRVWQMQTPQVFSYTVIRKAYDKLFAGGDLEGITDDAMVVERTLDQPVSLFEGAYHNMKITTPEDMVIAERMLRNRQPDHI